MKKVSLIALLLAVSFVNDATAGKKADGAAFANKWGVGNISNYQCKASGADYGWNSGETGTDRKWQKYLTNNLLDSQKNGKGAAYYVATEMKDKGYKFCKYIFGGGRSSCHTDSWTGYWPADNQDCFWLCEPGYYGETCDSKTPVATATHDFSKDKNRKTWIDGKKHSLSIVSYRTHGNKEADIPMFVQDKFIHCKNGSQIQMAKMTKKQEHDVVLVAKNLTVNNDNTLTYTVQPMVVRAAGTKGCHGLKASHTSWAFSEYVANERTDLCPGDLHYDNVNKKCIVHVGTQTAQKEQAALETAKSKVKSLEEQGLAILCNGWTKEKYDNKLYELRAATFEYENWRKMPADYDNSASGSDWSYGDIKETCTVFVCKGGKGYQSDPTVSGDFTCIDCNVTTDTTIHPSRLGVGTNGVCLTCKLGEVFNDGVCEPAKQIHKAYMAGDVKKGDLGKKLDASEQCWTKPTPDEYKSCMDSNGWGMYASSANDGDNNPSKGSEPSL